jgi:hypothetical protein
VGEEGEEGTPVAAPSPLPDVKPVKLPDRVAVMESRLGFGLAGMAEGWRRGEEGASGRASSQQP